jgi:ubiquilin
MIVLFSLCGSFEAMFGGGGNGAFNPFAMFGGGGNGANANANANANGNANANPFAGFNMNSMMNPAAMQAQHAQNPEMMAQIMNSPIMQQLTNNPELIRNMMMANPQMRALMDQNPQLAHMLNDPETLRQSLQMARNPALLQEMMRK